MICKHCHEEVTRVHAYRTVQIRKTIDYVQGEAFVKREETIEYPEGKAIYHFRCGHCGGDLSAQARHLTADLKRGSR